MRRATACATLGCVLFSIGLQVLTATGRAWLEVKSPHFTVISDAGEKSARSIAWQLEQVRQTIEQFWGWARVDFDKPLVVVAVADEAGMRALAPQFWEQRGTVRPVSVFVTSPHRHYIALRADVRANDSLTINPYMVAYWSYVTLVIDTALKRDLPLWFSRGLASVMSNTIVRESHLEVGHVIPWHLRRLSDTSRLKLRELVSVDRQSTWYTQGDKLETFDAESWAFVHFLVFGEGGVHRRQFDRFIALIVKGETPAGALETAFGNIDPLETGFNVYINRQLFQYMRVDVDVNVQAEGFATNAVPQPEAVITRAAFLVAMQRPQDARTAIAEARRMGSKGAGSYEAEGLLFDYEGKLDESYTAYGKAVDLGSKDFYAHYRLAQLMWARSHRDVAQNEARAALMLAGTSSQRKLAQDLIELTNRNTNTSSPSVASGPELTVDTKGVDFGPWIRNFVKQVKQNWSIPFLAMSNKGHVVVTFNVHKDGSITDLVVTGPSAIDAFDKAAVNAVASSNPTKPLPPDYPAEKALFTVTFYYNEAPKN